MTGQDSDGPPMVRVKVREDTEILGTTVSRDPDDDFYEVPEDLVVAFETAHNAFEEASRAISDYLDNHGLQARFMEDERWRRAPGRGCCWSAPRASTGTGIGFGSITACRHGSGSRSCSTASRA